MVNLLESVSEPIKKKKQCKGQVFKASINKFFNSRGDYVEKKTMKHLKRKSCKGCQSCGGLLEALSEYVHNTEALLTDDIQSGKLYTLVVCNITYCWETGHADNYDMGFIEIKEPELCIDEGCPHYGVKHVCINTEEVKHYDS